MLLRFLVAKVAKKRAPKSPNLRSRTHTHRHTKHTINIMNDTVGGHNVHAIYARGKDVHDLRKLEKLLYKRK